jgi:translation elongation factor EF-1alpha
MMETKIGHITHFFNRINVAVLSLTEELKSGDRIHILGHTTDLIQNVSSMEIEHRKVSSAGPGDEVALKVVEPIRKGDDIYKIVEEAE